MPSQFDQIFADAASELQEAFAERRGDSGQVDSAAAVYLDPRGASHPVAIALQTARETREIEAEGGSVEPYEVKRRVRNVQVWHGAAAGQLAGAVELNGRFQFSPDASEPATDGTVEEWAVEEIVNAGPVMTTATLAFVQERDRGRPGVM